MPPLASGKGKDTISSNVRELVSTYNQKGSIGNTKPKSKKHATKIATAIAYGKARSSK